MLSSVWDAVDSQLFGIGVKAFGGFCWASGFVGIELAKVGLGVSGLGESWRVEVLFCFSPMRASAEVDVGRCRMRRDSTRANI